MFGCRDVDSFLTEREKSSVDGWLVSGKQFHVMRDGPFHRSTILAGLWGGDNYQNMSLVQSVRSALLGVQPNLYKFYDQRILHGRVWPQIRWDQVQSWKYLNKIISEITLPSTTATTAAWSGSLVTVDPGPPRGKGSSMLGMVQPRTTPWELWEERDVLWNVDQKLTEIGSFVKIILFQNTTLLNSNHKC